MRVIAIDPGLSGGIAWFDVGVGKVDAIKMPATPMDLLTFVRELWREDVYCLMENVGGSRPGNAAKGARTFAVHQGHLEMALLATGISTQKVTPVKWMNHLVPGRTKGAENYSKRKNQIKAAVQARYPHLKVTLATADALGILIYALENQ